MPSEIKRFRCCDRCLAMRRLKSSLALGADVENQYFQKVAMPDHWFNQAISLWLGLIGYEWLFDGQRLLSIAVRQAIMNKILSLGLLRHCGALNASFRKDSRVPTCFPAVCNGLSPTNWPISNTCPAHHPSAIFFSRLMSGASPVLAPTWLLAC